MAMLDNAVLQPYETMDYFPQASIKVRAFTAEDFIFGCSQSRGTETWLPAVMAPGAIPSPLQLCEVDDVQLMTTSVEGRNALYPHPKTVDHVARRMVYRGAAVQAVIWGFQAMRSVVSG